MFNERVEELSLPGDVTGKTAHDPGQRTFPLPDSGEWDVLVRHRQEFSSVQTILDPVFVDELVVELLGPAAPQHRDDQEVQHSAEGGVDDVTPGLRDPICEILPEHSQSELSAIINSDLTWAVSSSKPAMLIFLPARKGRI